MKVMATGAFDLLHPGHGLYLEKAKELGGEDAVLVVVIARDSTVKKKKRIPVIDENQRLEMINKNIEDIILNNNIVNNKLYIGQLLYI